MTVLRKELNAAEIVRRCREAGLKATPQRLAIFRALLKTDEHPSAEVLYRSVQREMPSISLGTVYKTLDALRAVGLVEEVSRIGETRRYDANLAPHHHLICTRCNRIRDVELPRFEPPEPQDGFRGFKAAEVHVQILGVCSDCRDKR